MTTASTAAASCQTIFNLQRNFLRKAKLDLARQSSSLAEVDEVLEGEGESDRLSKLNRDVFVGVLDVRVLANSHGTIANVTLAGEFDAFLCGFDDNCRKQSVLA